MGGCCSSKYAHIYDRADINQHRELFTALMLSERDVGRFYYMFRKIDNDDSGLIELAELLAFLDLDKTPFTKRVFQIFDEDLSGLVDFREFILSLWNYCTLGRSTLPLFAFDLYDRDSSGIITADEVIHMLKDMYGDNYAKNVHAQNLENELLKIQLSGEDVDVEQFRTFSTNHPALMFHAFQIQEGIRLRVMGTEFWQEYSDKRMHISKGVWVPISDFLNIHMKKGSFEEMMGEANEIKKAVKKPSNGARIALSNSGSHAKRAAKYMNDEPSTSKSRDSNERRVVPVDFSIAAKMRSEDLRPPGDHSSVQAATPAAAAAARTRRQSIPTPFRQPHAGGPAVGSSAGERDGSPAVDSGRAALVLVAHSASENSGETKDAAAQRATRRSLDEMPDKGSGVKPVDAPTARDSKRSAKPWEEVGVSHSGLKKSKPAAASNRRKSFEK